MYLESIQVFDRKVGQVLQRLEDEGVADNTIVFLISDHGRAHIRDKQFLYDGGIRVPCIVRWPGHIDAGIVSNALVSGIDFAPTALSLAGLDVPHEMEGNIFLGPDAKSRTEVISARDRCDGTVDRIRCVRTQDYKYIRNFHPDRAYMQFNGYKYQQYPLWTLLPLLAKEGQLTDAQTKFLAPSRPYEELYDLQADPHELNNLAESAEHQTILNDLSRRLDDWIETYKDQGAVPEDPASIAEYALDMHSRNQSRMENQHGITKPVSPEEYIEIWEKRLLG
jgi:N-sulfoglucosamine sulfohydrolase